MTGPDTEAMRQAVLDGDREAARALAEALSRQEAGLLEAIDAGFVAGLQCAGELWDEGEYFLPELVQSAAAMKEAMAVLQPALARTGAASPRAGTVVIGTVEGDLHDIGKSLVAALLEAHGFRVRDLGADVPVERFVEEARTTEADLVGASALLTTTMPAQRRLVEALRQADLPRQPRVLVGGAPCTPAWAAEIGAAFAENAVQAVATARELLR